MIECYAIILLKSRDLYGKARENGLLSRCTQQGIVVNLGGIAAEIIHLEVVLSGSQCILL